LVRAYIIISLELRRDQAERKGWSVHILSYH